MHACTATGNIMCSVYLQRTFSAQHWEQLLRVMACSDMTLRQVVQRWPGIGDVSVAEVMQRLMCLTVILYSSCILG